MSLFSDLRARAASLLFRRREERELAEDLRFHLEMETKANLRRGLGPAEARRRALVKLGGVDQTKEAFRDARGVRVLEDFVRDIRLAMRSFSRTPGFTLTVVIVLGLGIGATTSIFSAVRAVVLRPLPYREPDQLYMLWESRPASGVQAAQASPANYLDWKERVTAFADVEAYGTVWQVPVRWRDRPVALRVANVTGGFFSMLGVRPVLGRDFREDESWASATWRAGETPVLLSAGTWRTVFGGDESVIGAPITFNGVVARVVGVMPDGFAFPDEAVQLWVPTGWADEARSQDWFRRSQSVMPVARLAAGVTPAQAEAELAAVTATLAREHPQSNHQLRAGLSPLQAHLVGDTRTPLSILLGAVALMLLSACANVGNLLLVRASARRPAVAVRAALGASRGRLIRQMLAESLTLAALGGVAGIALGFAGTWLLERLQPAGLLRVTAFPVDSAVIAFSAAMTAGAAILFGTFPALLVPRTGPGEAMRAAWRGATGGPGGRRAVDALVAFEIALAVLLVLGAGLLVRSIVELRRVDPGFAPEGVVAITLNVPGARYPGPQHRLTFYGEVLSRVRALPGVTSVAASSTLPLRDRGPTRDVSIAGRAADAYASEVIQRAVTPDYFETLGVPLLSGRLFTQADAWRGDGVDGVVLINEAMAREHFPGEDPVGQRIAAERAPDSTSAWHTIIGVVGDERQNALAMPARPEMIEPFAQHPLGSMYIYVRVAGGDPTSVVPAVRAIIEELDPDLPIYGSIAMEDLVADSMARDRFLMLLLLAFAGVALVFALVGVYGVSAQVARQRWPELGLRKALGASDGDIIRLTLGRGFTLVVAGVALGVAAALVATRAIAAVLYGVTPNDPVTFLLVTVVLGTAGLVSAWLPAWRASRIDPADTLRAQ